MKLSVKYDNGKHNEIDNSLGCRVVKLVVFTVLTPALVHSSDINVVASGPVQSNDNNSVCGHETKRRILMDQLLFHCSS